MQIQKENPKKPFTTEIESLDPQKDFERIIYLLTCHCFPWDMERALEFALFRTFAIPSISKLLAATGEFTSRPRKRYDDTELILYEILENGMDSERGKKAILRMNQMHERFKIQNKDFLYVLSTFIFEPIRWMENYNYRSFTEKEKEAILLYYTNLGKRMNIRDIPTNLAEFETFNFAYEKEYFIYSPSNQKVGDKTVDLLLGFYIPKFLFPIGRIVVYSLLDPPLLRAMGFPSAPKWVTSIVKKSLRFRAFWMKFVNERSKPLLGTKRSRPTYPEGYEIESLGTFRSGN